MKSIVIQAIAKFLINFSITLTPDDYDEVKAHIEKFIEKIPQKYVLILLPVAIALPFLGKYINGYLMKLVEDTDNNGKITVDELIEFLTNKKTDG